MSAKFALGALALAACSAGALAQSPIVFTQWRFNSSATPTGQIVNNPRPDTGKGTAVPLGMTNNYTFSTSPPRTGSTTTCDITSASGSGDSGSPNNCWRVRGSFDGTLTNAGVGWALAAPQFTQGAEFDVSTVNYSGITFTFDWFTTSQGVHNMQVQYSLNGGTTWDSIGPVLASATNGWVNNNTYDFSAITGANDNPNFRVRLVSVYDPTYTGPGAPTYTGASGGVYNNASGNWRFDRVTFTGTPIRAIGPSVVLTTNTPAVCNTGGPVTFTASVTGGSNPLSTSLAVSANLSSLGLSANQTLFDDGTNGDQFAGDGIFTFTANVPAGRPLGTANISCTVTDAQSRSGDAMASMAVGDCSINSASRVVISQTFGGGGNLGLVPAEDAPFDADFVEIYNRSPQTVDISGWSVQYTSPGKASGFDSTQDQVLLYGKIQPGQHMLVRMSDPTPGFNPLPTPDFAQLKGFGGMGNTGGRVALVRSTTLLGTNYNSPDIEDFIGYGTAAVTFEGVAPAASPVPSSNTAELRKNAGAQDTNQNFNDFAQGFPNPRNAADGGFLAITSLAVDRTAVCTGSSFQIAMTSQGGSGSTGITATADVSQITGSPTTINLNSNGSTTYTVPANAAQGVRTVTINLMDAQGRMAVQQFTMNVAVCTQSTAPVVISQVYGGGGNDGSGFNGDFAEIYNRSDCPVNMTGWSFQSARVSDQGFDSRIVFLGGIINPGEYRLIVTNQLSPLGAVLPAADFVPNQAFGMESSFGRVALVSSANLLHTDTSRFDVVDIVGYGQLAQTFEGVAPTGSLGDTFVAVRKNGGCQDTNQNAIDFDVVLANVYPHNSFSTPSPCGVPCHPVCRLDYNNDQSINPDDIGDYITDYFTAPPIPGPGGYAILCPDNPAPYDQGYKAGYTADAQGSCGEPNPDNLGDWITDYFVGC